MAIKSAVGDNFFTTKVSESADLGAEEFAVAAGVRYGLLRYRGPPGLTAVIGFLHSAESSPPCLFRGRSHQFGQRHNSHLLAEGIAALAGIHHQELVQLDVFQSYSHGGREPGRVRALAFNADSRPPVKSTRSISAPLLRGLEVRGLRPEYRAGNAGISGSRHLRLVVRSTAFRGKVSNRLTST